jgi:hypothetical protein
MLVGVTAYVLCKERKLFVRERRAAPQTLNTVNPLRQMILLEHPFYPFERL